MPYDLFELKNIHQQFASQAVSTLRSDEGIIGIAAAGSWIAAELDAFSDLDLLIVTKGLVGDDKERMMAYANRLGNLLNAFTGEHVGELSNGNLPRSVRKVEMQLDPLDLAALKNTFGEADNNDSERETELSMAIGKAIVTKFAT